MITANPTPISTYTFNEHRHRYAVWTAARAQRAFATNEVMERLLNDIAIQSFVENTTTLSQDKFDAQHSIWCKEIIRIHGDDQCAYGRAAKIIAIYLKTAVVLPQQGQSALCHVIHPPIDRILLQSIARNTSLKHFRSVNWTTLEHDPYWDIVDDLRKTFGVCNWKIETYWSLKGE